MLLEGGNVRVPADWHVDEPAPPGYCRVYWIHGGVVRYTDDREAHRLETGKIYVFPSTAPYHITTDCADLLDCTFIHIDVHPVLVPHLICLEAAGTAGAVFGALRAAYAEHSEAAAPLADAFVVRCLESGAFAPPSPFLAQVHRYIVTHLADPLTLRELSARFGYNAQYFSRRFKAAAGLPPHQYILHMRLQEAARLLRGEKSVAAVAEAVGFRDDKTFYRAFSRRFGVSPGRFRRLTVPVP